MMHSEMFKQYLRQTIEGAQNDKELWDNWMNRLTTSTQDALFFHYGLKGKQPHTLEETAQYLKFTPERVIELEYLALRKLHHRPLHRRKGMTYFLNND